MGRRELVQKEVVVSDCIDCGKTRGHKQTESITIYAFPGRGVLGRVSLCLTCITRRNLFCKVHKKLKMCFSDLYKKDGWGKLEILGTCPDCVCTELEEMESERQHYLVRRYWQKHPAQADAIVEGDSAIVFALLCIAQMYATTPERVLEGSYWPILQ
ncbi:MAG: hypothetical protein Q7S95_00970 [bacterium]|nr:hypothetical protein [bacterium]